MQNKSHKLAVLTSKLKLPYSSNFECYLKEVWNDLINRRRKNINDPLYIKNMQNIPGLTKLIFSKYYSLPGIIGDRLFRVFDSKNKGIIEYNEFKIGMVALFCGDYEKTLRFIFDFYDFDGNGNISKEDVKVVLLYVIFSNKNLNKNFNNNDDIVINNNTYDNQLNDMLNICFSKKDKAINFTTFTNIIENVNSDIYFMTYIFLLKQRPFSFKSIELYGNKNLVDNFDNELNLGYYPETAANLKTGNFLKFYQNINKNRQNMNLIINYNSDINNRQSISKEKLSENRNETFQFFDIKYTRNSTKNFFRIKSNELNKNIKNIKNKQKVNSLFEQNLLSTIYEGKLPNDLQEEMDNIKYNEGEYNSIEDEDILENLDSEKNNFSGFIYKLKDGQMIKLFFKLFYKDLFFYKNKSDTKHQGMHNLSGLFLKEEATTKILDNITYYSFSIIFPRKKHIYYCTDKSEFRSWKRCLKIATNYTNILKLYEIKGQIGVGSFSEVKSAINKITKEKVAVKIINKNKMSSPILESALTEIEIIKICQFPYIIKFIEAFENIDYIYIFMEYCSGGTLFDFLKRRDYNISERLCCNIIYKICLAVNYFHSYGITHRDLKLENILMTSEDDDADIRILDFGLGKIIGPNEKCSEPYGTIIFCAPEIILCKPYNKNVDSWSLGIITYMLLFARLPFYDDDKKTLRKYIVKNQPVYKGYGLPTVSEYAINFVQKFLNKNPNKRMTVEQALQHKWFQVFNKDNIMKINQNIKDNKDNINRNNIIQYFYQTLNHNIF